VNHRLRRVLAVVLLLLLVSAAAFVRFYRLEYSFIGGDQSIVLGIAAKFVNQGEIPLAANKSSAGIMNPPFLEYLLAIPLFLKPQLLGVVQFTALINLAAVVACYAFVAALVGRRAGLIAALLFAANPWAVYYSRLIWNPTPIPLFSTLLLGSLLAYFAGARRPIWLTLSFLWLAAIVQLHLASLVLIILVGLIFLLFRHTLTLKPLLGGVGLFVLTFVPFLLFVRGTGFTDVRAVLEALQGGEAVHFNLASALLARDLATGRGIFAAVIHAGGEWREAVWPWFGLMRAEAWLLLFSLIYASGSVVKARREFAVRRLSPRTAVWLIPLLWLVFPTAIYLRHGTYLQNYYFLYLYPAPFILMGLCVDDLWRHLSRVAANRSGGRVRRPALAALKLVLPALVGLIALWQFHIYYVRLDLTPRYGFDGRPVQQVDRLISVTRELVTSRPGCDVMVVSEGDSYETSPLGLLSPLLAPVNVRYLQTGRGLLVPDTCAVYVVAGQDAWASAWLDENTTYLPAAEIDAGEEAWRFYDVSARARDAFRASLSGTPAVGKWVNGVLLRQVTYGPQVHPGEVLELTYVWEVIAQPPHPRYHFYNHLLSQSDGTLVAQEDGPGVYSLYWRVGDLVVTRFNIAIPPEAAPGTYLLNTGLYTWPEIERVPRDTGEDGLTVAVIQIQ
jgi:4-amino-4-deoxy-L-arabinose transferase-like glycosyltransferase